MKTLLLFAVSMLAVSSGAQTLPVIFDFSQDIDVSGWEVEDDGVMGGVSRGSFVLNEEGHGVFSGDVSLENNGGFTSVQYFFSPMDLSEYSVAVIRLKGDGKRYQFRVESGRDERHAYIYYFKTSGEWETVLIPLHDMVPSWRGNLLDLPNYDGKSMAQVRFLIANSKAETFRLEIDQISLK